jgi:hypothetical protein
MKVPQNESGVHFYYILELTTHFQCLDMKTPLGAHT